MVESTDEQQQIKNAPDAIEYINVSDGSITGNYVYNSPDDAIDLNGCKDVKISNNIIYNSADKGILLVQNNMVKQ